MKLLTLIPVLMLTACASHRQRQAAAPSSTPGLSVSADMLRTSEQLKEYRLGRYVDPGDPMVMHESHPIYRIETSAGWDLTPSASTTTPTTRAATLSPTFNRDALLVELNKERAATSAFAEQTAALNQHLAAMSKAVARTEDVAEQNAALKRELANVQDRLDSLAGEIHEQKPNEPPSAQPSPEDKW
jgi:FtsZ-binding cell division protein ZapB